jgi:hypothetical protein
MTTTFVTTHVQDCVVTSFGPTETSLHGNIQLVLACPRNWSRWSAGPHCHLLWANRDILAWQHMTCLGLPNVVSQNPPASSDRQHEEPGGSQDCWWAPIPLSTAWNPAHDLVSGLQGMPPDLVPDQEGVEVISVSFLDAQTRVNISLSCNRLIGWLPISAIKSRLYSRIRSDLGI